MLFRQLNISVHGCDLVFINSPLAIYCATSPTIVRRFSQLDYILRILYRFTKVPRNNGILSYYFNSFSMIAHYVCIMAESITSVSLIIRYDILDEAVFHSLLIFNNNHLIISIFLLNYDKNVIAQYLTVSCFSNQLSLTVSIK